MKKLKAVIVIVAIMVLALLAYRDYRERHDETDMLYATVGLQKVEFFNNNGEYYLFLPAFADADKIQLSPKAQGVDCKVMQSSGCDALFITTQSGNLKKIYADKEYKETADMVIIDDEGNVLYDDCLKSFGGHGNITWYTEKWAKKSFGYKDAEGRGYTLFANATDATFIRNEIAGALEQQLGVRFAGNGKFVDVYINNEYQGCYYLRRDIDIAEDSIAITDIDEKVKNRSVTPEDISGGYLIEREFEVRFNKQYADSMYGFVTDNNECFVIHRPKNITEEENIYIKDYMNNVEKAIAAGYDEAAEQIDVDSFVHRFLSDEITKNYDSGVSSSYFYKDSDISETKLFYGPGWDFDMSLGNYEDWMTSCYGQPAGGLMLGQACEKSGDWFAILYGYEPFRDKVISEYNDIAKPYLEYLVNEGIDEYQIYLRDSAAMDSVRWSDMYENLQHRSGDAGEYAALRDFVKNRKEFLDSEWQIR